MSKTTGSHLLLFLSILSTYAVYGLINIHQRHTLPGLTLYGGTNKKQLTSSIEPVHKSARLSFISARNSNCCIHLHNSRPSRRSTQLHVGNSDNDNDEESFFYNDDAFGLIFLTGLLYLKDTTFATIFGGLSAMAASASYFRVFNGINNNVRLLVPGFVAILTWIVRVGGVGGVDDAEALKVESIVCVISFLWSVVQFTSAKRDTTL